MRVCDKLLKKFKIMEVERQSQQEKASQPADSQLERKSVPVAESIGGGQAEEEPHQSSLSRP